jgi:hypothetical protein
MNGRPVDGPGWCNSVLFRFTGRYLELDGSLVRYTDEGQDPTPLMRHGNPTRCFVYRIVDAICRWWPARFASRSRQGSAGRL